MLSNKRLIKFIQSLTTLTILVIFYYLIENQSHEKISREGNTVLYSNICHDDLERICLDTIEGAAQSILLIVYSLNDIKLIHALNRQAEKGVRVKVVYDTSTPSAGFQKLSSRVEVEGIKLSGLMHQKILVVDTSQVLIGSANMTVESLKLHDNLIVGLINEKLAEAIENQKPFLLFNNGDQTIEYWSFPQKGQEGLKRLINLIDSAKESIRIAMFTWTHTQLAEAVIRAHQRGVHVEIILDRGQGHGVCQHVLNQLVNAGLNVRLSSGLGLLHHKFVWIDEKYLSIGSANWTMAAFLRNRDCLLILHNLTAVQNEKMRCMWRKTKHLTKSEVPLALHTAA